MRKIFTIAILAFSINAFAQQWTTKTPMPTAVHASGVAVVNNIIYVVGGSNASTNLNTVYAYDPSNDTWTTKAPMTVVRGELAVAAVNGKIYAIGGYNNSTAVNTVEEYDPTSNTWTTKAPMTTTRSVISCEVINNKIYVVGGWPGNMTTLEEYTPATNSWATKAPCSLGRDQINGCAVINNKLFFIGGKNAGNSTFYTINEAYDPTTNTWTTYAALPQQRWSGATAVLNNEIHYFGGTNVAYSPNFSNHYIYNSTTDSWSNGLSMIHKRSRQVAATVNSKIYVIGGYDSTGVIVNWNEEYSTPCTQTVYDTIHFTVTDTLIINATLTGIHPVTFQNTIKIFPNPTNDHITIDFGSNFSTMNGYTLKITNSLSQIVYTTPINTQQTTVNLSTWTGNGIYFVHLIDASSNTIDIKKIVLQ